MKIKDTDENIIIPKKLFKEMMETYLKMEQILATIEILSDKEALKIIEESRREIAEGKYIEASVEDLETILK